MLRRAAMIACAVAACSRGPAPSPDPGNEPAYLCRMKVAPLREALRASGGDASRVIRPSSQADLVRLEPAKRYLFVVTLDGRLALAPLPADAPHNAYAHPILADGAAVRTAGGITVVHDDGQVRAVSLDAASRAYCTATESLRPAIRALRALGVPSERITVEGGVFACVVPSGPPKRYGPIMVAVARRHEMLGRALAAGRWDLAGYAVEELGEDIEELPLALPPHDARVDPLPIARGFYEGPLRALTAAVATRDARVAREAWQATSRGCNGCHQAVGKGFIVVPETPGDAVPVITADDAGVPAD